MRTPIEMLEIMRTMVAYLEWTNDEHSMIRARLLESCLRLSNYPYKVTAG